MVISNFYWKPEIGKGSKPYSQLKYTGSLLLFQPKIFFTLNLKKSWMSNLQEIYKIMKQKDDANKLCVLNADYKSSRKYVSSLVNSQHKLDSVMEHRTSEKMNITYGVFYQKDPKKFTWIRFGGGVSSLP